MKTVMKRKFTVVEGKLVEDPAGPEHNRVAAVLRLDPDEEKGIRAHQFTLAAVPAAEALPVGATGTLTVEKDA